eukprot:4527530-Amphidinium_carterae.1
MKRAAKGACKVRHMGWFQALLFLCIMRTVEHPAPHALGWKAHQRDIGRVPPRRPECPTSGQRVLP